MKDREAEFMMTKKLYDYDAYATEFEAKVLSCEEIERKHTNDLSFRADPSLHYEEFRIVDAVTNTELQ